MSIIVTDSIPPNLDRIDSEQYKELDYFELGAVTFKLIKFINESKNDDAIPLVNSLISRFRNFPAQNKRHSFEYNAQTGRQTRGGKKGGNKKTKKHKKRKPLFPEE